MPAQRVVSLKIRKLIVKRYRAGHPLVSLGHEWGYDYKTTRRVLVEEGVPIRERGGPRRPLDFDVAKLIKWAEAGESCRQIALRLGTYPNKIAKALRDAGREPADGRHRRGKANPITRGGRRVGAEGYVTVLLEPEHYWLAGTRSGHTMLEHRFVMAKHLGRPLFDYENVHHKNGNRADNRLRNLELWEKGQPCGQRANEAPPRKHCPTCSCC